MAGPSVVFEALEDFEAEVNRRAAGYRKGQRYTAKDGDAWDDLRNKIAEWQKQGKVRVVGSAAAGAPAVTGGGTAQVVKRS